MISRGKPVPTIGNYVPIGRSFEPKLRKEIGKTGDSYGTEGFSIYRVVQMHCVPIAICGVLRGDLLRL